MSKTAIIYKDIAPGSDDAAAVTAPDADGISDISLVPYGVSPPPLAALELNYWALDGTVEIIDEQPVAFWSEQMSGADCLFTAQPVITMSFTQQFSSVGVTITFDSATGEYCNSINIKWYQQNTLKADVDFTPDSAAYFCEQMVESFDKIVITLKSTILPRRRARVDQILIGLVRTFGMSELRDAKITSENSELSTELPISKLSFTLDSRQDVNFMFQLKQPVEARNDNNLIGVYYIDGHTRSSESVYKIECYDAVGVLDESYFTGGVYLNGYSARQMMLDILDGAFDVDFEVADKTLYGVLLPDTKRAAIQQVLFAWGVCASTDGRRSIRVFSIDDTVTAIGTDRTYTGPTVEISSIVTEVKVTAHTYAQSSDGSVEINGVKYSDTKTVYTVTNPNVTATDKANVKTIASCTLVSPSIGQATAQRVYDYYQKRRKARAKIVWRGELLGDCVSVPNTWGGITSGNIAKMEITLSNTVAANLELTGSST